MIIRKDKRRRLLALLLATTVAAACPARAAEAADPAAERHVDLYRDRWGVPHIYAEREEDGFLGLGYAVGQDRLSQVLFYFRMLSGRLAEAFGPGPLDAAAVDPSLKSLAGLDKVPDPVSSDRNALQMRLLEDGRANLSKLPAQTRADIESYITGLRQFEAEHPERVPSWAVDLEPGLVLAFEARVNLVEFGLASAMRACAPARPDAAKKADAALRDAARGSNAWAIGKSRAADGQVMHLTDSHSPFEYFGTAFYTWRMKAGSYDSLSLGFPLQPFALFGHSPDFAWGWTDYPNQVSDCYAVRVEPGEPRRYKYDGAPKEMEVRPYEIAVRGGTPIRGEFEYTTHNGVLSPVIRRDDDTAFVVSSPYMGRAGYSFNELRDMVLSRTRADFEQALSADELLPDNLIAAGRDGTLLFVKTGREPVREPDADPSAPQEGNVSGTAWRGVYPYAKLMRIADPAIGYVANDNVSPDRMMADSPIRRDMVPSGFVVDGRTNRRQLRTLEVLDAAHGFTAEQALALAEDSAIYGADRWAPTFAALLAAPDAAGQPETWRDLTQELASFDGRFVAGSKGALAHLRLRQTLFKDHPGEVDAITDAIEGGAALDPRLTRTLRDALLATHDSLLKDYGSVAKTFGDVYRVGRGGISLPANGVSFLTGSAGDQAAIPTGGGKPLRFAASLNVLTYNNDAPLPDGTRVATGGHRAPLLTVFGDRVRSYSALAFGVSDDPASPHYADQTVLWSENRLKPTYFDFADLQANLESHTVLRVGGE